VILGACGSVAANAATVNGHNLSSKGVTDELHVIVANQKYVELLKNRQVEVRGVGKGTFNSAYSAQVLTRQIFYQLIADELGRRRVKLAPADLEQARNEVIGELSGAEILKAFPVSYQNTLVRRRAQFTTLANVLGREVTGGGDAQAYYAAHKDEFQQACVSAILVDAKDKADSIAARLAKGEDFAAVAKGTSIDPKSAPKGGDLGCITHDIQADPAFLKAAYEQPVGQVGPVVPTSAGFEIIKVISRDTLPYDQVAGRVKDRITTAGEEKEVGFIQDAVRKAKITVNPTFGHLDRNQDTPRVVPTEAPTTLPSNSGPLPTPPNNAPQP